MERHSSYLLTQTDLDTVLAPVYSSVQVSTALTAKSTTTKRLKHNSYNG